jgi:hypothetical protein
MQQLVETKYKTPLIEDLSLYEVLLLSGLKKASIILITTKLHGKVGGGKFAL